MTVQEFARWVEPLAAGFRENRAQAIGLARSLNEQELSAPTGDTGWSVRDELAHIVSSEGDFIRVLSAATRGEAPDTSVFADIDDRNARNLKAREGQSIARIADDLEENGITLQSVLGRLSDGDESRQLDGFPFTLGQMVAGYAQHEPYHLGQIRAAIKRTST